MLYRDVQKQNSRRLVSSPVSRAVSKEQRHLRGQEASEKTSFRHKFSLALEVYYPSLHLAPSTQTLKNGHRKYLNTDQYSHDVIKTPHQQLCAP